MSAGLVEVLTPVYVASRGQHTQMLQTPEQCATAYAHVVRGAPSLTDHVGMGYDCLGQRVLAQSGA
jgi:hypothetical protein